MYLAYLYGKIMSKLRGKCLRNTTIGHGSKVYSGTSMAECSVDRYSYIGYDCHMDRTRIGSFCSISDHVFIGGAEHPMHWASASAMFINIGGSGTSKRFARHDYQFYKDTIIGNDVWIGHGVIIKTGVHIGNGAVIGSGAVVTKDIPPYAIVAGVPAKIIKFRFDDNTIKELESLCWWNLPDEDLMKVGENIQDINKFIQSVRYIRKGESKG